MSATLVWCYMPDRNIFQRAIRSLLQRVIVRSLRKFDHITVTNSSEEQWMIRSAAVPVPVEHSGNGLFAGSIPQTQ